MDRLRELARVQRLEELRARSASAAGLGDDEKNELKQLVSKAGGKG